ncbi:CoA transferase [Subtercola sp. YIM 133946]|uniref:CoA transferase n=1 Tax=Subtercola sp. YIM 133946 TaxID=3118909 RepID=UPI002F9220EC
MTTETSMLDEMLAVLPGVDARGLVIAAAGGLPSAYPVSELATAAVSAAALAAARFAETAAATRAQRGEVPAGTAPTAPRRATVNRQLASAWFGTSLEPIGWKLPSAWDALAGDYRTLDGWIRLHTNAPHHRAAALAVLGLSMPRTEGDDSALAAAVVSSVATWNGNDLEAAVVAAGGCAAVMRSRQEWASGAPGRAVAAEPLIEWSDLGSARRNGTEEAGAWGVAGAGRGAPTNGANGGASGGREAPGPLAGVRVLDLTRVLAGPIATRFLAMLGADVLRVDPPGWNEAIIPEVTLGKRTTRLDLTDARDRAAFTTLLAGADVLVHGYRAGALDGLGFGSDERQRLRPGLIDISLDAYGWSSPIAGRRGFDSLVQMSTGIAHAGMRWASAGRPVPLPVQALDHATGYLMAAAALSALAHRRETGAGRGARLSLARTAELLLGRAGEGDHDPFAVAELCAPEVEETGWGPARRLRPPFAIEGVTLAASPARELGLDAPAWW